MTTVWADNAARFATNDREKRAEQLLMAAVREGVAAFGVALAMERKYPGLNATEGLAEVVEVRLREAAASAENILGPRSATGGNGVAS